MAMPATQLNTNPLAFEELATALASLSDFSTCGVDTPIEQYQQMYSKAMKQPLGYREITELTGNGLDVRDYRSGRAAWLLLNTQKLHIASVHSVIWHKVAGRFSAPMLGQISRALNVPNALSADKLQRLGGEPLLLDIIGVKDGVIHLVQTVWSKDVIDSAIKPSSPGKVTLFKSRVFNDPVIEGNAVQAMYMAYDLIHKAFPEVPVCCFVLAMHPDDAVPDFELYRVDVTADRPARIVMQGARVLQNSIDFAERLQDDHDILLMLPERACDDSFSRIPPCRGGRTLAVLASAARRQLDEPRLAMFKEQQFRGFLKEDYNYEVTRDKVRHDLVDRLVGQGFLRKWGSEYFLTTKGVARYQYCLAKYTTVGDPDSMRVLDRCTEQRKRIVERFGCLI